MSEATIKIKKVKFIKSQEKIKIEYKRSLDGREDDLTGMFSDEAAPEFYKAMENLSETASGICELPDNMKGRLTVYGVTFHYNKDGNMSAMLHCKLIAPTSKQEIKLDTPMRKCPLDDFVEDMTGQYLTDTAVKNLWNLEAEARKYLEGRRAQMNLFEAGAGEQQPVQEIQSPVAEIIKISETMAN